MRLQFVHTLAFLGRNGKTLITNRIVERHHHLLITQLIFIEQVGLIENKDDGHTVSLSRSEEAIDKGGGGLRTVNGDDEYRLIDIRRNDMALLGEVLRLADDIVTTIFDSRNKSRTLLIGNQLYTIAHRHRIGTADTLQAKVTFYLRID